MPAETATGIPPSMPDNVVSGTLKSPCVSMKTSPTLRSSPLALDF